MFFGNGVGELREVIDAALRLNTPESLENLRSRRAAEAAISRARAAGEGGLHSNANKCGSCGSWGSREGDAKAGYRCCGCQESWAPALETRREIEAGLRTRSLRKGAAR